ncbi:MAG TPA: hypothetical protein EYP60_06880 [bacterium (Candidatus Stahlbacteria)]|nr:hypothetical protein [Candidatus Stahlbacteria bacterium]
MTQKQKHLQQFIKAKSAIQLLFNEASLITDYTELEQFLNTFSSYILKIANEKNNVGNRNIIAFKSYYEKEAGKKRSVKTIEKKGRVKRLSYKMTYKDYTEEYLILRARHYSWRKLAKYSEQYFKVKVSKDTLRKYIGGLENGTHS